MSTKRQPSKQRRQTQNQRARAALEARRQAAAAAPASAGAEAVRTAPPAKAGSVLTRLRGGGSAARPAAARSARPASNSPIGHRAALSALLAAIAAAVVGVLLLKVPVDRSGEAIVTREALVAEWARSADDVLRDQPDASPAEVAAAVDEWLPGGSKPYGEAYWPMSISLLLPVLGTGLGLRAVSRRSSAKLVNRTMYVTLFGALLTFQLSLVFLPAVISLAVAGFQVRRAEMTALRANADTATDTVIDVDAVDAVDAADADQPELR